MCAGQDGCTPCHAAAIAGCLSLHNFRAHTAQTIEHAFNSTGHYNFVSVYGPVTLTPKIMEMAEKVLNEKCDQKELWNSKCVGDQATARCEGSKYALNSLCTGDQVCQDTVDGPVKKAKCVLRA